MNKIKEYLSRSISYLYDKIFKINDSPHKIALGLGLGVFSGILPGTGPIAALFLSMLFRVNRAAALIGAAITNTWFSIVTFILAIKAGSAILGLNWHELEANWEELFKDFHLASLFKESFLGIFLPVISGYLIISLIIGFIAYLVTLVAVILIHKWRKDRK